MPKSTLETLQEMFVGKRVRLTHLKTGKRKIVGVCVSIKIIQGQKGHFDLKLKNGLDYFFVPVSIGENEIEGKCDPWTDYYCKIEVMPETIETKKVIAVQSIDSHFAGIMTVGDLVFCPCHLDHKATKIKSIELAPGSVVAEKDVFGSYTHNRAQCVLEDGRVIHPTCLRPIFALPPLE